MQELITRLTQKAGISNDQAQKAIEAVREFVKEKFPMMAGAVDNLLDGDKAAPAAASTPTQNSGFMDKISDVIPGETGQKVEDFAKNAADKAEDLFDAAKDKLTGLFGGDKK
ncbi:MAG: hypothetical protein EOP53_18480 [Sphingobacteriales bacterium]|nr:MAG: hypothetical protein EOP53_18480 [Sphingobacteriales bacterium]